MAGALGLEPRVPILETGGLPINRYPYGVSSKNRTYITRATIWCSTIELYQPYWVILKETIPNLLAEVVGFEPTGLTPQQISSLRRYDHFGTPPNMNYHPYTKQ